jgi:hypothetical protein
VNSDNAVSNQSLMEQKIEQMKQDYNTKADKDASFKIEVESKSIDLKESMEKLENEKNLLLQHKNKLENKEFGNGITRESLEQDISYRVEEVKRL